MSHSLPEALELSCLAWLWVTPTFDLVAKEMLEQVKWWWRLPLAEEETYRTEVSNSLCTGCGRHS
jgi:hypothetical protein